MDQAGVISKSAVDRMACISILLLPLQILIRNHPGWRGKPVVVVEDNPLSPILWLNTRASRAGILPGMRFASALSLNSDLCSGTVSEEETRAVVLQIHKELDRFSPRVEPCQDEPGIFWIDAGGLGLLYGSLENWTEQIHTCLSGLGLSANIAVGFSRFGTYAIAKSRKAVTVIPTIEAEETESHGVRLIYLKLEPKLQERLDKLAVYTVGDLLAIPGESIAQHLGKQARELYRFAAGERSHPLQPWVIPKPLRAGMELEENESDSRSLLFRVSQLLAPLLKVTAGRYQAAAALRMYFRLEDGMQHCYRVQAAEPTLDFRILLELASLRLETVSFVFPPVELSLEVESVGVTAEKLNLFQENLNRDTKSAMRTLAQIRAEFGPNSVLIAQLKSGHLPEARFAWYPLDKLVTAKPQPVAVRSLVRRNYASPQVMEDVLVNWLSSGPPPQDLINGGWWVREIRRDYRFVDTGRGETLWVYYDQRRKQWYVQGRIE